MTRLKLLAFPIFALLAACSERTSEPELVDRDGLHYQVDAQLPFTGTTILHYKSGNLLETETYRNGKLDGPRKTYYENGQSLCSSFFKDDKLEGVIECFYEDGTLASVMTFVNGEQNGPERIYHLNGLIKFKANYKEEVLIYPAEEYDLQGQVEELDVRARPKKDFLRLIQIIYASVMDEDF
tara:strand:- start:183 stop:728 length:546 start_codon:yes stop_codon:yes gene_type:complete